MRQLWKHIKWMPVLMTLTIVGIAAFQLYWLKKAYEREERTLEIRSNITFRESIQALQASKLKIDKILLDSALPTRVKMRHAQGREKIPAETGPHPKVLRIMNVLNEKVKDTTIGNRTVLLRERVPLDTTRPGKTRSRKRLMEFLYEMETLQDTITVKEIQ